MKNPSLPTAETTVTSAQKCTHIKANAAVFKARHREPLEHHEPVAFQKYFLLVGRLFLSEWGSGSKVLSVCNEISIWEKHDQSLREGERGDSKRQGDRRCVSQGVKGAKQRDAGQERNKNRPLTLSAVTRAAASCGGERSQDFLQETKSCFWSGPAVSSGARSTGCVSFGLCNCALLFFYSS